MNFMRSILDLIKYALREIINERIEIAQKMYNL